MVENYKAEHSTSYKSVIKTTSLFGGVQLIQIVLTMIRTKFVALYLGTTGVGFLSLLNTPLNLIASLSGFGINYSAVRDISESARNENINKISRTIISFRRLVLFTGLIGTIVVVLMAERLSKWSFGDDSQYWTFFILSLTLMINSISGGQKALLQGLRKYRSMAKATAFGAFLGLLVSIPCYYFLRVKGIVPALVASSFISLILSWYYARKVSINRIRITIFETLHEAKTLIKLGVIFSISNQIGNLTKYLILTSISNKGGVDQVGLYSAGMSFMGTYVGLIFTAMSTDYYPRLAAINKDNNRIKTMVNQQSIVSLLILFPIVIFLLWSMPIITRLFLSIRFIDIVPYVNLTVLGVILKALSYCIGYISFAKGDTKLFFWMEGIFSNGLNLVLTVLGYKYFGLIGVGYAYILLYVIYPSVLYFIIYHRYNFRFDSDLIFILVIVIIVSVFAYLSICFMSSLILFLILSFLQIFAILFSLKEINKRIDLKSILKKTMNHRKSKDKVC